MLASANLDAAFERIDEYWSPQVISQVNGQLIKVAKIQGERAWHSHDAEDEMFIIHRGELEMQLEGQMITMKRGDVLNLPRGTRHNPVAKEECWIILIEPASTLHFGTESGVQGKSLEEQMKWINGQS